MPIILSLYRKPRRYSQHCFIAMNSEPKEDVSTVVCFLLEKYTRQLLIQTRKPVLDLRVTESDAVSIPWRLAQSLGLLALACWVAILPSLPNAQIHLTSSLLLQILFRQLQDHWDHIPIQHCGIFSGM